MRLFGQVGRRSSTSFMYAKASCLFRLADWIRLMMAAARWPIVPANGNRPDPVLHPIVIDGNIPVVDVMRQRLPAHQAVFNRFRRCTAVRHTLPLRQQPCVQGIGRGPGLLLPNLPSLISLQFLRLPLDGVQHAEQLEHLLGKQAAKAALGAQFAGILVSDRYNAYAWVEAQRRQLCWAHLLRDFTKMAERSGGSGRIGDELIALTQRMFAFWYRVRDGTWKRDMFACHMLFLRHRIETLLREGTICRHAKTARTCRHILNLHTALWTFIDTPGVEPTNNHAERTLRGFVIWRKISCGTQSDRGSRYVERIMTVVGSCKLQGRNLLDFLTQAIQAHWGHGSAPSLVPA